MAILFLSIPALGYNLIQFVLAPGWVDVDPVRNDLEKAIEAKGNRFMGYQRDLMDFARSNAGNGEYQIANELYAIADWGNGVTDSVRALFMIYDNLSCEADRVLAGKVIKLQLKYYAGRLDIEFKATNSTLSLTRVPAIAASGTQL